MYFWIGLVVFVLYRIDFVCFDVVFILHCNVSYCFRRHVDACILQCSFFSCQLAVDLCIVLYLFCLCMFLVVTLYYFGLFLDIYCWLFTVLCQDYLIMYISLFSSILDMYTVTISLSYLLILQVTYYIFFMVVLTDIVRSKPTFAMQMCDQLSWSQHAGFLHCCIFMFRVEYIHIMFISVLWSLMFACKM